jgi:pectate lyase
MIEYQGDLEFHLLGKIFRLPSCELRRPVTDRPAAAGIARASTSTQAMRHSIFAILVLCSTLPGHASPSDLLKKPDEWFKSSEGARCTTNILSWQSAEGSWPKNLDVTKEMFSGDRAKLKGTFDNGATTDELRYLARAHRAVGDAASRQAFLRGLDLILEAQYPNGGWPQSFPPGNQYPRHITFNDHTMVRLLVFLREVASGGDLSWVDAARRQQAGRAFDKGLACILKCQVVVDGKKTVWCAQHDEVTLAPVKARSYELPSLSGSESAGILRFLMTLDAPSAEVIEAVEAGVAWFDSAKIEGIRIESRDGDRKVVGDAGAPPLWARFYQIETNRPFFCDRDGVIKFSLSEIGKERRNGYAWYGNWGNSVANDHRKWRQRIQSGK